MAHANIVNTFLYLNVFFHLVNDFHHDEITDIKIRVTSYNQFVVYRYDTVSKATRVEPSLILKIFFLRSLILIIVQLVKQSLQLPN
jgi:hypothetical protein